MARYNNRELDEGYRPHLNHRILAPQEERTLLGRVGSGSLEAEAELVRHNLRLVVNIAEKFSTKRKGEDIESLVGVGNLELVKAAQGFDLISYPNIRFTSLATGYITRGILAYLRSQRKHPNISSDDDFGDFDSKYGIDREDPHTDRIEKNIEDRSLVSVVKQVFDFLKSEFESKNPLPFSILGLNLYEGKSFKEIAEDLGIDKGKVKYNYYRARRALREELLAEHNASFNHLQR